MSALYRLLYAVGVTPWERMPELPVSEQVAALLGSEAAGGEPLPARALDLGCGSGVWAVELAKRGWQVTAVDAVPKAIRRARERAHEAGVEVRFIEADVTALRGADVGSGFRLVLDFGTAHGLKPEELKALGREVSAVAAAEATLLMYATAPGRRWPLPRGLDRAEIEAAYGGWQVIDQRAFDVSGTPLKHANPSWYRLRRRRRT
jgi:SAM-dependent methyltransferase